MCTILGQNKELEQRTSPDLFFVEIPALPGSAYFSYSRAPTDYREIDACGKPSCEIKDFALPLRREHLAEWNCDIPACSFNHDHVRDVEREYLMARVAQRGGDLEALAAELSEEELLSMKQDSGPDPHPQIRLGSTYTPNSDVVQGEQRKAVQDGQANDNDHQPSQPSHGPASTAGRPQRRLRVRAPDDVDINSLRPAVRQRIQALQAAIAGKRPPPPRVSRRSAPRRRSEKWLAEEEELLLLLRDHGFGFNQIQQFFPWRNKNPLQHRASKLQRERDGY
ncbi:hypothetical protein VTK56DRAFT_2502 [Thermocarpiscus australiensis]